jgi:glycosyltransferase involved in cell wall biosynthesis
LHDRICASVERLTLDYELVFVDDRSRDGGWEVLRSLARTNSAVRALRLSRNFGQHAAITAGLSRATGRWVVVMDCDLEDPPEEIPRLVEKAREGYDLVLSRRVRPRRTGLRRFASRLYFRLRAAFMGVDVDPDYCTLSVLSQDVVRSFLSIRDRNRQYMLILHWLGFRRAVVDVGQAVRPSGQSAYTFRALVRLAVDGFFFETTVLLTWIVFLGFAVALAGAGLATFFLVSYFVLEPLPGFTSLAVLILLVGGFIIISTGVTGLYIGKLFEQVKKRPLFVISERAVER